MAKKAKAKKSDDGPKALLIAAMKRGISVLESSMVDKRTRPEEGAYPVDLTLQIEGDITVGAATEPGPSTVARTIGDSEILAGILASRKRPSNRVRLLDEGIAAARAATAKGVHESRSLKQLVKDANELAMEACRRVRATKRVSTPARAGAVAGKPGVRVTGTQGQRTLSLEVDAA